MREDQHRFLTLLGQLPARLTAEQAAWVLNCQAHDARAPEHDELLIHNFHVMNRAPVRHNSVRPLWASFSEVLFNSGE